MVAELKNYQSQVQAYQFEIDRVNSQIKETKKAYFQMKRDEVLGIVPEMDDEYDGQGEPLGQDAPYYQDDQPPMMADMQMQQQMQQQYTQQMQQQQDIQMAQMQQQQIPTTQTEGG